MTIDWHDSAWELLRERGVWWPARSTLIVADVHFGKDAAFRRLGVPLPAGGAASDCLRLTGMVRATRAERLVVLGDLFHSRSGMTDGLRRALLEWRNAVPDLEIDLVRGNHDLNAGDPWPELRIICHDEPWSLGDLQCRHHPADDETPHVCGHLHPAVAIPGAGRRPCFVVGARRMILPAFGDYTGSSSVVAAADETVVAADEGGLIEIPRELCRGGRSAKFGSRA